MLTAHQGQQKGPNPFQVKLLTQWRFCLSFNFIANLRCLHKTKEVKFYKCFLLPQGFPGTNSDLLDQQQLRNRKRMTVINVIVCHPSWSELFCHRSITRELINNCNEFDRQLEFIKRWPHMCTLPLSVLVDSFGTEHHLRCLSKCNPPQSSPPGTPLFIRKPGSKEAAARCTLP